MLRVVRRVHCGTVVILAALMLVGLAAVFAALPQTAVGAEAAEPPAPADQEYTGSKRCASCHFDQYMKWKKDKHSKAFDLLTVKYEKDVKCLKCHTTGYGEATGFKDKTSTASLMGVTCESCHGPGSKHETACQPLTNVKKLSPEQEKAARDSIWLMVPRNICIECHLTKAHKDSQTPKELQ